MTFFNENFQLDLRFNILHKFVDKFVVCESKFDDKGNPKKLNFNLEKFEKFKNKIIYLVLENKFPDISLIIMGVDFGYEQSMEELIQIHNMSEKIIVIKKFILLTYIVLLTG